MLSRVATSLYLVGRNLERADHLARILDVHASLALDRSASAGSEFWARFLELAGRPAPAATRAPQAIELIIAGPDAPSIREALLQARRAAQAVRPSLSSEVYQQLNRLSLHLQDTDSASDRHGFLNSVQVGIHLLTGLVEDTMAHDEAWEFIRLGRYLERATNVTRLVTRKSVELKRLKDDAVEWAAVLKCCSSFESYRWRHSAPISPVEVVRFLLLDPKLTRSAGFSVAQAREAVGRIDGPGRETAPHREVIRLSELFQQAAADEVAARAERFARDYESLRADLERSLRETYFQPRQVAARLPSEGGELSPHPHPQ